MTELTAAPITEPAIPILEASATLVAAAAAPAMIWGMEISSNRPFLGAMADGVVLVNAVVECGGSHDARARRIGVLGRHTGSSRCKSASFRVAIRVPTRCESYVTFNRYHQLIKGGLAVFGAIA